MTNEIEGAPPGSGYTHVHRCPKCIRDKRCTDDCTREPPYYTRGVHLVCSECAGEIEHVDTDVMRSVIAELERWERSPSLACQTVAASMRAVLGDAPHLDGGARALDVSEALREARVQGMREGARIMQECMRLWRGDPDGTMPDWENADTTLAAAIEAVRKGER